MVKRRQDDAEPATRYGRGVRAAIALGAALLLARCITDPKPKRPPPLVEVEIFGTGDTMVYIGDSARFSVRLAPKITDVDSYQWEIAHDRTYDSLETKGPSLARAWTASQTGRYAISVGIKTRSEYWIQPFAFSVRVDSGAPKLEPDSTDEYPFGAGNRFKVKARDPNGTIVKYYWSLRPGVLTDSSDGPEWILPDNLLGYEDVYCKVRDNSGLSSDTLRKGIRILPKSYGAVRDDFRGVAALPDGGLIAVGHTESFDTRKGEPWIARLDAKGGLIAKTTVKRSADFGKYGQGSFFSLSPAGSGIGFVAAGSYRDSTRDDGLIVGIDAQGNAAWKTFVTADSGNRCFVASLQADAGHHVAVGYYTPDIHRRDTTLALLAAVDPTGAVLSAKTFRHGDRLAFQSVAKTRDGNILVAASGQGSALGQAGYLYKLTPAGDSLWARPIDQSGLPAIAPQVLVACRSGGFALLLHGYGESRLLRLDEEGKVVWGKTIFTFKGEWPRDGALIETATGDFLLSCELPYAAQPSGVRLIKVDADGNLLWSRDLGVYSDEAFSLVEMPSGGFTAAGTTREGDPSGASMSAWIFRFDGDGRMIF